MADSNAVYYAFALTTFAGLSTSVGGALAFWTRSTNNKLLSVALGFSAGVMIYVSFVELFAAAQKSLSSVMGPQPGSWVTVISFFGGMSLVALIDKLVPSQENPHEILKVESLEEGQAPRSKLLRTGLMVGLAISIHNFPEGLATFAATLQDVKLGLPVAVAIAIHNIPEGIAVAIPVYFATHSRIKSFGYATLSGIAEPAGALLGYLVLMPYLDERAMGIIFAGIAGIMVFVSLDELLPAAREYGEHHLAIYGVVGGMAVMALSLLLFV